MRTHAGMAALGWDDLQLAVVCLDDLAGDGQAQAQAHVARGVERRRDLLCDGLRT